MKKPSVCVFSVPSLGPFGKRSLPSNHFSDSLIGSAFGVEVGHAGRMSLPLLAGARVGDGVSGSGRSVPYRLDR